MLGGKHRKKPTTTGNTIMANDYYINEYPDEAYELNDPKRSDYLERQWELFYHERQCKKDEKYEQLANKKE
jgi:hypothetical protein